MRGKQGRALRDHKRPLRPLRRGLRLLRPVLPPRGGRAGVPDARRRGPSLGSPERARDGRGPLRRRDERARGGSGRCGPGVRRGPGDSADGRDHPLRLARRNRGGRGGAAQKGRPVALSPQPRDLPAVFPVGLHDSPVGRPRADGASGAARGSPGLLRGTIRTRGDVGGPGGPRPRPAGIGGRFGPPQLPDARPGDAAREEAPAPRARGAADHRRLPFRPSPRGDTGRGGQGTRAREDAGKDLRRRRERDDGRGLPHREGARPGDDLRMLRRLGLEVGCAR